MSYRRPIGSSLRTEYITLAAIRAPAFGTGPPGLPELLPPPAYYWLLLPKVERDCEVGRASCLESKRRLTQSRTLLHFRQNLSSLISPSCSSNNAVGCC